MIKDGTFKHEVLSRKIDDGKSKLGAAVLPLQFANKD